MTTRILSASPEIAEIIEKCNSLRKKLQTQLSELEEYADSLLHSDAAISSNGAIYNETEGNKKAV